MESEKIMAKSKVPDMSQEYKLLFITYEYDKFINGGVGRVINGLTGELSLKSDFDIFLLNTKAASKKWTAKLFRIENRKCRAKSFKSDYTKVFIRLVEKEKYGLIHFMHSGQKIAALVKNIKEHYPGIKLIYSCHSISRYDRKLRNTCPTNVESEDFIFNECDHIHLLNRTSLGLLEQTYPRITEKTPVTIIPNGIEEEKFRKIYPPMKRKLEKVLHKQENLLVVCMTRWSYGKGLEYFLDAIPGVVKEVRGIQFVIAGKKKESWENGYTGYLKMVEEKIDAVKEFVTVFGWLDDKRRNTLYAVADIWVMPSLLEYFPYSIMEPAVCKIPIISSRIDSVTELLKENEECLFFEPGNNRELAGKIVCLCRNRKLREQLRNNAYNKLHNDYRWHTITEMYLNMYKKLLIQYQSK